MAIRNYTTFIKFDPNNQFTSITADTITLSIARNITAYACEDMGIGYFNGDFTHKFETAFAATSDAVGGLWSLSNIISDTNGDTNTLVLLYSLYGGQWHYDFYEVVGGTSYGSFWAEAYTTAPRYFKFVRDEAVGTYGTLYIYIYSDSARTILLGTISHALHIKEDYRYAYGFRSLNDGATASLLIGYIKNLELIEGAGGTTPAAGGGTKSRFIKPLGSKGVFK